MTKLVDYQVPSVSLAVQSTNRPAHSIGEAVKEQKDPQKKQKPETPSQSVAGDPGERRRHRGEGGFRDEPLRAGRARPKIRDPKTRAIRERKRLRQAACLA